jgi:PHD/YefM family antitoxin component YafN of YafNO toxin-antitoxin module
MLTNRVMREPHPFAISDGAAQVVHLCTHLPEKGSAMETQKVGIREFRDNLATYLLESEAPVAITRHGDTVGYYIPARRKRTDAEKAALTEASARLQQALAAAGVDEEDIVADFKRLRANSRK